MARDAIRGLRPINPTIQEPVNPFCSAVRVMADAEIGLFSDEIVVNCAP